MVKFAPGADVPHVGRWFQDMRARPAAAAERATDNAAEGVAEQAPREQTRADQPATISAIAGASGPASASPCDASQCSASSAAMQPMPALVIAWR